MKRQPIPEDHPYRSFLVPYDRDSPDPRIPQDLIHYIESRQSGLTPRDIAKLDGLEWFTFHTYLKALNEFAIPGLRPQNKSEVRYVKRFNSKPYGIMLGDFLDYRRDNFKDSKIGGCFLPGYRLTSSEGERFYPVKYNGDLAAWRKLMSDKAERFATLIGHFDHGRFVVSDGREMEFADMHIGSVTRNNVPPDF